MNLAVTQSLIHSSPVMYGSPAGSRQKKIDIRTLEAIRDTIFLGFGSNDELLVQSSLVIS